MERDELANTLREFMESHEDNQDAYDDLKAEFDQSIEEFEERVSEFEEKLDSVKEKRAEEASEFTNIPSDILADRFSLDELDQMIEEAETDFSEEESSEEDEEDQRLTTFTQREERGRNEGETKTEYRDRARQALARNGLPVSE